MATKMNFNNAKHNYPDKFCALKLKKTRKQNFIIILQFKEFKKKFFAKQFLMSNVAPLGNIGTIFGELIQFF